MEVSDDTGEGGLENVAFFILVSCPPIDKLPDEYSDTKQADLFERRSPDEDWFFLSTAEARLR